MKLFLFTRNTFFTIAMALPMATFIANSHAGDATKGADVFAANCAVCHSVAKPVKNKVGPGLFGVVNRPSGSIADFDYSPAMKSSNHIWTPENLNTYITDPAAFVPNNKMPFKGLSSETERADLIAFLSQKK